MKKMVCEVCEGTSFLKEDGRFVCQSCGMQYSAEEAKGMLKEVEGSSDGGSAPAANNSQLQNFLQLAENAISQSKNSEAENYANKILEIDGEHARAWMIKGEAVGWQSTAGNCRLSESISCWELGLKYSAPEDKEDRKAYVKRHCEAILKALMDLHAKNFSTLQSDDNVKYLTGDIKETLNIAIATLTKLHVTLDTDDLIQYACQKMNTAAVNGSDDADKDFGPERRNKTKGAWDRWRAAQDNCIALLDFALGFCKTESLAKQVYKNIEILQNNVINSCSYRFEATGYSSGYVEDYSLTASAKSYRRQEIRKAEEKMKKTLQEIADKAAKAQKERNEKYWKEHAAEKEALLKEKEELNKQKAELEKKVKELKKQIDGIDAEIKRAQAEVDGPVPALQEEKELDAKIAQLHEEHKALGLFKFKDRREIQLKIEALGAEKAALKKKIEEQEAAQSEEKRKISKPYRDEIKKINDEIAGLKKQISELDKKIGKIDKTLTENK